ncbi:MAG TPA: hypothetical protein VIR54_22140 [Vicinamibacterales bacterium]
MALAVVLWADTGAAQTPKDAEPPAARVQLLPRTTFLLSAEHLWDESLAFVWDMNFGGALDVIDYGTGRATFLANYQAILGDEIRHFDPNQGNYILSGTASVRTPSVEVAGVFYHQSRHLADRDNRVAVAWNMAGVRLERSLTAGRTRVDGRVDVRGVVARAFVDYTWEIEGAVRSDVQIRPTVAVLFAGTIRRLGVDDSQNRGDQTGFRGETGVRFEGRRGAMEFFLAAEQRIDPSPLEFGTARWASVGFRLLSR